MKKCTKCKKLKEFTEFVKSKPCKDGYHAWCKRCMCSAKKKYYRKHRKRLNKKRRLDYKKSPKKYMEYNKKAKLKKRKWINDYKSRQGCSKCPEKDPRCLDFHHIDPTTKSFVIGERIKLALATIQEEVQKCIVLCANCHRKLEIRYIS